MIIIISEKKIDRSIGHAAFSTAYLLCSFFGVTLVGSKDLLVLLASGPQTGGQTVRLAKWMRLDRDCYEKRTKAQSWSLLFVSVSDCLLQLGARRNSHVQCNNLGAQVVCATRTIVRLAHNQFNQHEDSEQQKRLPTSQLEMHHKWQSKMEARQKSVKLKEPICLPETVPLLWS